MPAGDLKQKILAAAAIAFAATGCAGRDEAPTQATPSSEEAPASAPATEGAATAGERSGAANQAVTREAPEAEPAPPEESLGARSLRDEVGAEDDVVDGESEPQGAAAPEARRQRRRAPAEARGHIGAGGARGADE
ncbi:MAG: hypothetical protein RLO52_29120, partial [Sandaracinaceae bacterium]